jgi:hypothetical protein
VNLPSSLIFGGYHVKANSFSRLKAKTTVSKKFDPHILSNTRAKILSDAEMMDMHKSSKLFGLKGKVSGPRVPRLITNSASMLLKHRGK